MLVASFVKNFSVVPEDSAREARSFRRMLGWMTFLLTWQLLIAGLFLPLDFLYQSAIVFLVAVIVLDLIPQYVFGELTRVKVLATGTVLFALLVIVLSSARWII
jgi:energy-coupling factor transporter transmembrane protein EcfT